MHPIQDNNRTPLLRTIEIQCGIPWQMTLASSKRPQLLTSILLFGQPSSMVSFPLQLKLSTWIGRLLSANGELFRAIAPVECKLQLLEWCIYYTDVYNENKHFVAKQYRRFNILSLYDNSTSAENCPYHRGRIQVVCKQQKHLDVSRSHHTQSHIFLLHTPQLYQHWVHHRSSSW